MLLDNNGSKLLLRLFVCCCSDVLS